MKIIRFGVATPMSLHINKEAAEFYVIALLKQKNFSYGYDIRNPAKIRLTLKDYDYYMCATAYFDTIPAKGFLNFIKRLVHKVVWRQL
jgi:hypothetical protein